MDIIPQILKNSSYAAVVSRENVQVTVTHAALHNVSVCAADICNAYLSAPSSEKYYVIYGPEFGSQHEGCAALIRRALYGGKAIGRDYWYQSDTTLLHQKFTKSCLAGRRSFGGFTDNETRSGAFRDTQGVPLKDDDRYWSHQRMFGEYSLYQFRPFSRI